MILGFKQNDCFYCNKIRQPAQTDFALLDAYFENHQSGMRGGNSRTEYFFKLLILTSDKLNFDSVWLNNNRYEVFVTKERTAVSNKATEFFIHDTITLRISDIHGKLLKKQVKYPVSFNGIALLRYTCNGDLCYFTVNKIEQKKSPDHQ